MSSGDYIKPVRPPRAVRTPKETTGHLMQIISTLSISQNSDDREKEEKKLEREFNDSDKKLNRLVEDHKDDLSNVMQVFSRVYENVGLSKTRCQEMQDMLTRCKQLLHCKRHELKIFWIQVVEHQRVLCMLKEIELVFAVPEKIPLLLKDKLYIEATELLVSSISLLESSLGGIDALKELKAELYLKREELLHIIVNELHKLLYLTCKNHIMKRFKRHGSGRLRNTERDSRAKISGAFWVDPPSPPLSTYPITSRDINTSGSGSTLNTSWSDGDESFSEIEMSTRSSISNLVDCLALLNGIPETVEALKDRCQQEIFSIVRRSAQHVAESAPNVSLSHHQQALGSVLNKEQQNLLLDLLELIFEQLKCMCNNHKSLLQDLKKITGETPVNNENAYTYEIADMYSNLQSVLEIFIGEYVDIQNSSSAHNPAAPPPFAKVTSHTPQTVALTSFFLRKRTQKPKNYALFKFDYSSHAISMKTYLQEQKEALSSLKEKGDIDAFDSQTQVFICPPSNKNITTIYRPLAKFIAEIESELNLENGTNCLLHTFMSGCVKVFLGQLSVEVAQLIESASKSLENWRTVSISDGSEQLQNAEVNTNLLHSVVYLDDCMNELKELLYLLPHYSSYLTHIMCNMLQSYRESCQNAYSSLIQPPSEDKRIISSSWARDKDISRLLRSLPNWTNLHEKDCASPDFEESPEEIRLRNKKESEILIANLTGDTFISEHEILADPHLLHNLGLLHESMEWLGTRILNFCVNLSLPKQHNSSCVTSAVDDDEIGHIPEPLIESLKQIAKEYINLASTCLLHLHLEVRVHCFYYLQPLPVQGYATRLDSQEPDPEIVKLNNDLSKADESLQLVLKPSNIKYIFEGLGELLSTILINSTNKIKRMNENGVKKMIRNIYALQQNLTGITMFREVALDRARQYFDLLNHSPEEILNLIVENGPQFQELEYSAAFHLLQRSQPGGDISVLNRYLDRLHQILNEVAVSV